MTYLGDHDIDVHPSEVKILNSNYVRNFNTYHIFRYKSKARSPILKTSRAVMHQHNIGMIYIISYRISFYVREEKCEMNENDPSLVEMKVFFIKKN